LQVFCKSGHALRVLFEQTRLPVELPGMGVESAQTHIINPGVGIGGHQFGDLAEVGGEFAVRIGHGGLVYFGLLVEVFR